MIKRQINIAEEIRLAEARELNKMTKVPSLPPLAPGNGINPVIKYTKEQIAKQSKYVVEHPKLKKTK